MPQNLVIDSPQGRLAARLHRPSALAKAGVVIAHGLFSSMASEKLTALAQALAGQGYLALQYDAMGCGGSQGDLRRTTLSTRVAELLAAAQSLQQEAPGLPLVYLGSSLGGTAALAAGQARPPACTVTWSAPVDLPALFQRLAAKPDPPDLPDMPADIGRHDLKSALAQTSKVLFVHGQEDEVVPVAQAHLAHEWAAQPKELLVMPGADHRFSNLAHQAQATRATLAWLERCLG